MMDVFRKQPASPDLAGGKDTNRESELLNSVLNSLTYLTFLLLAGAIFSSSAPRGASTLIGAFFIVLLILRLPMRLGYTSTTSILLITSLTVVITLTIISGGTIRVPGASFYILTILMSGLLIGRQAILWITGINIALVLGIIWAETAGRLPAPVLNVNVQQGLVFAVAAVISAILLNMALRKLDRDLDNAHKLEGQSGLRSAELEQQVERQASQLEESRARFQERIQDFEVLAESARMLSSHREIETLLPQITQFVSERFNFYHVGIFLLDEGRNFAVLRAANSEGGQRMLERGHRLKIAEQGIVGFVAYQGKPRVALDVGEEMVYFNNPDLPETRSEVALPLIYGREVIGVLDIQSTLPSAFSQQNVEIFTILADQVSVAIQNAKSYEQSLRSVREAEIASAQLTGQIWSTYARRIQSPGYRYDGLRPEPLKPTEKSTDGKDTISIPVRLRGQNIGHLRLKSSEANRQWTDDERAIIESTAERLALALESSRLLEEAQKRAARESFLSVIGARLGSSFQLDSIMRDTVEELGQTFTGTTVSFQLIDPLSPPKTESGNGRNTSG